MRIYFDTPEKIAALDADARAWIGTPFLKGAAVRGAGVDCVQLTAALMGAAGVMPDGAKLPKRYIIDAPEHRDVSPVTEWVHAHMEGRVMELPWHQNGTRPGDVIGFRRARGVNHVAVVIARGDLIHTIKPLGVQLLHLSAIPFLAHQYRMVPEVIFRPIATALK